MAADGGRRDPAAVAGPVAAAAVAAAVPVEGVETVTVRAVRSTTRRRSLQRGSHVQGALLACRRDGPGQVMVACSSGPLQCGWRHARQH